MSTTRIFSLQSLKILLFFFCVTGFYNCSDDDNDAETGGDLIGTWRAVEYTYEGESVTSGQGVDIETGFSGVARDMDLTLSFDESNETVAQGSYVIDLTFTVDGQTTTQSFPVDDYVGRGTYSRSGNVLTIDGELVSISAAGSIPEDTSSSQDYIIEELTDSRLRLSFSFEQDQSQSGFVITSSAEGDLVLIKE